MFVCLWQINVSHSVVTCISLFAGGQGSVHFKRDLLNMLPQHLKQIRVLMLNDMENLQRTLFRLEQGNASSKRLHF